MAELKQATTHEEQLAKLKERGVLLSDVPFCKQKLEEINYYRFTAYFLPFRMADGTYRQGTSFHKVYRIYEFDRKLRRILFSAVEEVEIYLRSKFAYFHAHRYGADGYLNPANFSDKYQPDQFRSNLNREIKSNRNVLFVKHHMEQYDGRFPIWVIVELFTFGMLSRFFEDMTTANKKELAKELYGTTPKILTSWLRCVTDLRNICAHYGRLYYRIFSASPSGFDIPEETKRRLWGTMLALKALYPSQEKWNNEVVLSLTALFEEYQDAIHLYHLAFPPDWLEQIRK